MSRILLVDDEKVQLAIAKDFLKKEDDTFEVVTSLSANEALVRLNKESIDVIVADYLMPEMNGLELLDLLRSRGNTIPFIMLTGKGGEEVAMQALNLGVDYYVIKSGNKQRLYVEVAHKIRKALKYKDMRDSLRKSEEKYRLLVERVHEGIWKIDKKGLITFANASMGIGLGCDSEEMRGRHLLSFIEKNSQKKCKKVLKNLEKGITEQFECGFVRKDGSLIYAIITPSIISDSDGNYDGAIFSVLDITSRKQAEDRLRESEDRFRLMFENAPLGYQSLDENGHLLDVNQAWLDITGYSREEVIGRRLTDFLIPKYHEKFQINFPLFKEAGCIRDIEYEIARKDGEQIFVEFNGRVGYDEHGRFKRTHCIFQDITERKRSEERVQGLKDFYESILENVVTGVWVTNRDDVIEYANKGMTVVAGIPREQIEDARVLVDFPESTLEYFKPYYLKAKETLQPIYYEAVPVVTPAKRQSYQSGWLIPRIKDSSFNGMICTVEDITIRKLAEDELRKHREQLEERVTGRTHELLMANQALNREVTEHKQTEEALRESESKSQAMLSAIPDLIFQISREGVFLSHKGEQEELFAPPEGFLHKRIDEVMPEEISKPGMHFIEKCLRTSEKQVFEYSLSLKGELRRYECRMAPSGKDEVLVIVRDITERKQAEEQLKRQKKELSEFVHTIAHDLQNFLIAIKGYADLLHSAHDKTSAEKIGQLTLDMNKLLTRSVALADAGLIIEKTGEENLTQLVSRVAEVTIPSNISYSIGSLPTVACDLEKVSQIFQNLFENAVAHGKPDKIEVQQTVSDVGVNILVANNGAPIPPEIKPNIFNRGFSTKRGGTGLGLAIVEKLCHAHRWEIHLEDSSEVAFRLFIPFEDVVRKNL
ncbi:MAG: PAS domain S-box protein [Candidatus Hodarchaeales archaeon]